MPTYVALLRAVNVGGRYYKMADLRDHLTESGLEDVETHIQTGNVRFRSSMRSAAKVEKHVEEVLGEHCKFEVPSVIFTPAQLREVYDDAMGIEPPSFGQAGRAASLRDVLQDRPHPVGRRRAADRGLGRAGGVGGRRSAGPCTSG